MNNIFKGETPEKYQEEFKEFEQALQEHVQMCDVNPSWKMKQMTMQMQGIKIDLIPPEVIGNMYEEAISLHMADTLNGSNLLMEEKFNYTALVPSAIDEKGIETKHKIIAIRTYGDIMTIMNNMGPMAYVVSRVKFFKNSFGQMS